MCSGRYRQKAQDTVKKDSAVPYSLWIDPFLCRLTVLEAGLRNTIDTEYKNTFQIKRKDSHKMQCCGYGMFIPDPDF
jgi:hypothetical protein